MDSLSGCFRSISNTTKSRQLSDFRTLAVWCWWRFWTERPKLAFKMFFSVLFNCFFFENFYCLIVFSLSLNKYCCFSSHRCQRFSAFIKYVDFYNGSVRLFIFKHCYIVWQNTHSCWNLGYFSHLGDYFWSSFKIYENSIQ